MWIKGYIDSTIPVLVNTATIQSIRLDGSRVVCDLTGNDAIEVGKYKTPDDAKQVLAIIETEMENYEEIIDLPTQKVFEKQQKDLTFWEDVVVR